MNKQYVEISPLKQFHLLIRFYHPDRIRWVNDQLLQLEATKEKENLRKFLSLFDPFPSSKELFQEAFAFEPEFGIDPYSDPFMDLYETGTLNDKEVEQYGFIEAINDLYYGNLDFSLGLDDLSVLDGELDLTGLGIEDLDGIQYCIRVIGVDLSMNELCSIEPLLGMPSLEWVNLSDNPLLDHSVIEELEYRGVEVII